MVEELTKSKELEEICLYNPSNIDITVNRILNMHQLKSLSLGHNDITNCHIAEIVKSIPNIKTLNLLSKS